MTSLLTDLLGKYLAKYLDGVTEDTLQWGLWAGTIELKNLRIKRELLDSLTLPISIKMGYVGKLRVEVPWVTLWSSPIRIVFEDILVITGPTQKDQFDADSEAKRLKRLKANSVLSAELYQKALDDAEAEGKSAENVDPSLASSSSPQPTYPPVSSSSTNNPAREIASAPPEGRLEAFLASLVKNSKIEVRRLHIRYEDGQSDLTRTIAAGITLRDLFIHTSINEASTSDEIEKMISIVASELKTTLEGLSNPTSKSTSAPSSSSQQTSSSSASSQASTKSSRPNLDSYAKLISSKLTAIFKTITITDLAIYFNSRDALFLSTKTSMDQKQFDQFTGQAIPSAPSVAPQEDSFERIYLQMLRMIAQSEPEASQLNSSSQPSSVSMGVGASSSSLPRNLQFLLRPTSVEILVKTHARVGQKPVFSDPNLCFVVSLKHGYETLSSKGSPSENPIKSLGSTPATTTTSSEKDAAGPSAMSSPSIPSIHLQIDQEQLACIGSVSASLTALAVKRKFGQFRPAVSPSVNPRAWWLFIRQSLFYDIQQQKKRQTLDYITHRRAMRIKYVGFYRQKLLMEWGHTHDPLKSPQAKFSPSTATYLKYQLESLDNQLEADDIIFFRAFARYQLESEGITPPIKVSKSRTSSLLSKMTSWMSHAPASALTGGASLFDHLSPHHISRLEDDQPLSRQFQWVGKLRNSIDSSDPTSSWSSTHYQFTHRIEPRFRHVHPDYTQIMGLVSLPSVQVTLMHLESFEVDKTGSSAASSSTLYPSPDLPDPSKHFIPPTLTYMKRVPVGRLELQSLQLGIQMKPKHRTTSLRLGISNLTLSDLTSRPCEVVLSKSLRMSSLGYNTSTEDPSSSSPTTPNLIDLGLELHPYSRLDGARLPYDVSVAMTLRKLEFLVKLPLLTKLGSVFAEPANHSVDKVLEVSKTLDLLKKVTRRGKERSKGGSGGTLAKSLLLNLSLALPTAILPSAQTSNTSTSSFTSSPAPTHTMLLVDLGSVSLTSALRFPDLPSIASACSISDHMPDTESIASSSSQGAHTDPTTGAGSTSTSTPLSSPSTEPSDRHSIVITSKIIKAREQLEGVTQENSARAVLGRIFGNVPLHLCARWVNTIAMRWQGLSIHLANNALSLLECSNDAVGKTRLHSTFCLVPSLPASLPGVPGPATLLLPTLTSVVFVQITSNPLMFVKELSIAIKEPHAHTPATPSSVSYVVNPTTPAASKSDTSLSRMEVHVSLTRICLQIQPENVQSLLAIASSLTTSLPKSSKSKSKSAALRRRLSSATGLTDDEISTEELERFAAILPSEKPLNPVYNATNDDGSGLTDDEGETFWDSLSDSGSLSASDTTELPQIILSSEKSPQLIVPENPMAKGKSKSRRVRKWLAKSITLKLIWKGLSVLVFAPNASTASLGIRLIDVRASLSSKAGQSRSEVKASVGSLVAFTPSPSPPSASSTSPSATTKQPALWPYLVTIPEGNKQSKGWEERWAKKAFQAAGNEPTKDSNPPYHSTSSPEASSTNNSSFSFVDEDPFLTPPHCVSPMSLPLLALGSCVYGLPPHVFLDSGSAESSRQPSTTGPSSKLDSATSSSSASLSFWNSTNLCAGLSEYRGNGRERMLMVRVDMDGKDLLQPRSSVKVHLGPVVLSPSFSSLLLLYSELADPFINILKNQTSSNENKEKEDDAELDKVIVTGDDNDVVLSDDSTPATTSKKRSDDTNPLAKWLQSSPTLHLRVSVAGFAVLVLSDPISPQQTPSIRPAHSKSHGPTRPAAYAIATPFVILSLSKIAASVDSISKNGDLKVSASVGSLNLNHNTLWTSPHLDHLPGHLQSTLPLSRSIISVRQFLPSKGTLTRGHGKHFLRFQMISRAFALSKALSNPSALPESPSTSSSSLPSSTSVPQSLPKSSPDSTASAATVSSPSVPEPEFDDVHNMDHYSSILISEGPWLTKVSARVSRLSICASPLLIPRALAFVNPLVASINETLGKTKKEGEVLEKKKKKKMLNKKDNKQQKEELVPPNKKQKKPFSLPKLHIQVELPELVIPTGPHPQSTLCRGIHVQLGSLSLTNGYSSESDWNPPTSSQSPPPPSSSSEQGSSVSALAHQRKPFDLHLMVSWKGLQVGLCTINQEYSAHDGTLQRQSPDDASPFALDRLLLDSILVQETPILIHICKKEFFNEHQQPGLSRDPPDLDASFSSSSSSSSPSSSQIVLDSLKLRVEAKVGPLRLRLSSHVLTEISHLIPERVLPLLAFVSSQKPRPKSLQSFPQVQELKSAHEDGEINNINSTSGGVNTKTTKKSSSSGVFVSARLSLITVELYQALYDGPWVQHRVSSHAKVSVTEDSSSTATPFKRSAGASVASPSPSSGSKSQPPTLLLDDLNNIIPPGHASSVVKVATLSLADFNLVLATPFQDPASSAPSSDSDGDQGHRICTVLDASLGGVSLLLPAHPITPLVRDSIATAQTNFIVSNLTQNSSSSSAPPSTASTQAFQPNCILWGPNRAPAQIDGFQPYNMARSSWLASCQILSPPMIQILGSRELIYSSESMHEAPISPLLKLHCLISKETHSLLDPSLDMTLLQTDALEELPTATHKETQVTVDMNELRLVANVDSLDHTLSFVLQDIIPLVPLLLNAADAASSRPATLLEESQLDSEEIAQAPSSTQPFKTITIASESKNTAHTRVLLSFAAISVQVPAISRFTSTHRSSSGNANLLQTPAQTSSRSVVPSLVVSLALKAEASILKQNPDLEGEKPGNSIQASAQLHSLELYRATYGQPSTSSSSSSIASKTSAKIAKPASMRVASAASSGPATSTKSSSPSSSEQSEAANAKAFLTSPALASGNKASTSYGPTSYTSQLGGLHSSLFDTKTFTQRFESVGKLFSQQMQTQQQFGGLSSSSSNASSWPTGGNAGWRLSGQNDTSSTLRTQQIPQMKSGMKIPLLLPCAISANIQVLPSGSLDASIMAEPLSLRLSNRDALVGLAIVKSILGAPFLASIDSLSSRLALLSKSSSTKRFNHAKQKEEPQEKQQKESKPLRHCSRFVKASLAGVYILVLDDHKGAEIPVVSIQLENLITEAHMRSTLAVDTGDSDTSGSPQHTAASTTTTWSTAGVSPVIGIPPLFISPDPNSRLGVSTVDWKKELFATASLELKAGYYDTFGCFWETILEPWRLEIEADKSSLLLAIPLSSSPSLHNASSSSPSLGSNIPLSKQRFVIIEEGSGRSSVNPKLDISLRAEKRMEFTVTATLLKLLQRTATSWNMDEWRLVLESSPHQTFKAKSETEPTQGTVSARWAQSAMEQSISTSRRNHAESTLQSMAELLNMAEDDDSISSTSLASSSASGVLSSSWSRDHPITSFASSSLTPGGVPSSGSSSSAAASRRLLASGMPSISRASMTPSHSLLSATTTPMGSASQTPGSQRLPSRVPQHAILINRTGLPVFFHLAPSSAPSKILPRLDSMQRLDINSQTLIEEPLPSRRSFVSSMLHAEDTMVPDSTSLTIQFGTYHQVTIPAFEMRHTDPKSSSASPSPLSGVRFFQLTAGISYTELSIIADLASSSSESMLSLNPTQSTSTESSSLPASSSHILVVEYSTVDQVTCITVRGTAMIVNDCSSKSVRIGHSKLKLLRDHYLLPPGASWPIPFQWLDEGILNDLVYAWHVAQDEKRHEIKKWKLALKEAALGNFGYGKGNSGASGVGPVHSSSVGSGLPSQASSSSSSSATSRSRSSSLSDDLGQSYTPNYPASRAQLSIDFQNLSPSLLSNMFSSKSRRKVKTSSNPSSRRESLDASSPTTVAPSSSSSSSLTPSDDFHQLPFSLSVQYHANSDEILDPLFGSASSTHASTSSISQMTMTQLAKCLPDLGSSSLPLSVHIRPSLVIENLLPTSVDMRIVDRETAKIVMQESAVAMGKSVEIFYDMMDHPLLLSIRFFPSSNWSDDVLINTKKSSKTWHLGKGRYSNTEMGLSSRSNQSSPPRPDSPPSGPRHLIHAGDSFEEPLAETIVVKDADDTAQRGTQTHVLLDYKRPQLSFLHLSLYASLWIENRSGLPLQFACAPHGKAGIIPATSSLSSHSTIPSGNSVGSPTESDASISSSSTATEASTSATALSSSSSTSQASSSASSSASPSSHDPSHVTSALPPLEHIIPHQFNFRHLGGLENVYPVAPASSISTTTVPSTVPPSSSSSLRTSLTPPSFDDSYGELRTVVDASKVMPLFFSASTSGASSLASCSLFVHWIRPPPRMRSKNDPSLLQSDLEGMNRHWSPEVDLSQVIQPLLASSSSSSYHHQQAQKSSSPSSNMSTTSPVSSDLPSSPLHLSIPYSSSMSIHLAISVERCKSPFNKSFKISIVPRLYAANYSSEGIVSRLHFVPKAEVLAKRTAMAGPIETLQEVVEKSQTLAPSSPTGTHPGGDSAKSSSSSSHAISISLPPIPLSSSSSSTKSSSALPLFLLPSHDTQFEDLFIIFQMDASRQVPSTALSLSTTSNDDNASRSCQAVTSPISLATLSSQLLNLVSRETLSAIGHARVEMNKISPIASSSACSSLLSIATSSFFFASSLSSSYSLPSPSTDTRPVEGTVGQSRPSLTRVITGASGLLSSSPIETSLPQLSFDLAAYWINNYSSMWIRVSQSDYVPPKQKKKKQQKKVSPSSSSKSESPDDVEVFRALRSITWIPPQSSTPFLWDSPDQLHTMNVTAYASSSPPDLGSLSSNDAHALPMVMGLDVDSVFSQIALSVDKTRKVVKPISLKQLSTMPPWESSTSMIGIEVLSEGPRRHINILPLSKVNFADLDLIAPLPSVSQPLPPSPPPLPLPPSSSQSKGTDIAIHAYLGGLGLSLVHTKRKINWRSLLSSKPSPSSSVDDSAELMYMVISGIHLTMDKSSLTTEVEARVEALQLDCPDAGQKLSSPHSVILTTMLDNVSDSNTGSTEDVSHHHHDDIPLDAIKVRAVLPAQDQSSSFTRINHLSLQLRPITITLDQTFIEILLSFANDAIIVSKQAGSSSASASSSSSAYLESSPNFSNTSTANPLLTSTATTTTKSSSFPSLNSSQRSFGIATHVPQVDGSTIVSSATKAFSSQDSSVIVSKGFSITKPLLVDELVIHSLALKLSISTSTSSGSHVSSPSYSSSSIPSSSSSMAPSSSISSPTSQSYDSSRLSIFEIAHVNTLLKALGVGAGGIDNARLSFPPVGISRVLVSPKELTRKIIKTYLPRAAMQLLTTLGSVRFIGSPWLLVQNLSEGLEDLVMDPIRGQGGGGIVGGALHGAENLFIKSIYGLSTSASNASGSIAKLLSVLLDSSTGSNHGTASQVLSLLSDEDYADLDEDVKWILSTDDDPDMEWLLGLSSVSSSPLSSNSPSLASPLSSSSSSSVPSSLASSLAAAAAGLSFSQGPRSSSTLVKPTSHRVLASSIVNIGSSLLGGASALVVNPVRGWKSNGAIGVVQGIFSGVATMALKPSLAVAQMIHDGADHFRASAQRAPASLFRAPRIPASSNSFLHQTSEESQFIFTGPTATTTAASSSSSAASSSSSTTNSPSVEILTSLSAASSSTSPSSSLIANIGSSSSLLPPAGGAGAAAMLQASSNLSTLLSILLRASTAAPSRKWDIYDAKRSIGHYLLTRIARERYDAELTNWGRYGRASILGHYINHWYYQSPRTSNANGTGSRYRRDTYWILTSTCFIKVVPPSSGVPFDTHPSRAHQVGVQCNTRLDVRYIVMLPNIVKASFEHPEGATSGVRSSSSSSSPPMLDSASPSSSSAEVVLYLILNTSSSRSRQGKDSEVGSVEEESSSYEGTKRFRTIKLSSLQEAYHLTSLLQSPFHAPQ